LRLDCQNRKAVRAQNPFRGIRSHHRYGFNR